MSARHLRWAVRAGVIWLLTASPSLAGDRHGARAEPCGGAPPGGSRGDVLLGEWWTDAREGRVRFTKASDGTFRGTTTCCVPDEPSPERPAKDIHNPDPKLRERATVGIVIIWKLAYEDGEYSGGYVYNPRDGKTYRFAAEIIDDRTIEVRGYLGIPLLGQSQIWRRAVSAGKKAAEETRAR